MAAETAVILPTYNEIETAPVVVSQLLDFQSVDQIVVVDDGEDGTAAELTSRFPTSRVHVIFRHNKTGLASAVLRGFDIADADILVCMDADGQHPVGSAVTAATLVEEGADMAVGTRRGGTGSVAHDWALRRRVLSHGASGLAWLAVPQARQLTDPMSGLFAIRSSVYEAARDQLRPTGYKIGLELLARCPLEDVAEFGYTFQQRQHGASNLGLREYLRYLRHLGRLTVPARRRTPSIDRVQEGAEDGAA